MVSTPATVVRNQMLRNVALFLLASALHIVERARTGQPLTQLVVTVIVGLVLVGVLAWRAIRRAVPVQPWVHWAGVAFMGYLAVAAIYRMATG
jgi:chromate transport protein ChrA